MVKNLKLTDDNYEIALKLLEKLEYANQETTREALLAELMNLVPVTLSNRQQDVAVVKKLASTVVEHVQALKESGGFSAALRWYPAIHHQGKAGQHISLIVRTRNSR